MRVLFDTSPLENGHSGRGIGRYTRELLHALRALKKVPSGFLVQGSHEIADLPIDRQFDYDLIHYPFFDLFFATLPVRRKTPVIVTVHDVIPLLFPKAYRPGIKGFLRFLLQKWRLKSADAIITDSEASKKDIILHLGIRPHKIFVVPLAASHELEPVNEYYMQKYTEDLKLPGKYILYIGDINYNKNLPTLLLALTQLPSDVHLCVISHTFRNTAIPEGKNLAKIISDNSLSDRIHVLKIPTDAPEKMSAVMARAKCLVQPSLAEGFGLPVLEAMQVGTIVVCSNVSSLPEVAGDAAILVDPTVGGIADGIQQALSLRGEERAARIETGFARAKEFSWQRAASETLAVYESVLKKGRA